MLKTAVRVLRSTSFSHITSHSAYQGFINTRVRFSSFMSDFAKEAFLHTHDKYDGVIVNEEDLPEDDASFKMKLSQSLEHWTNSKRRGIWLKLPLAKARFVPIAADMGFRYHHAEKDYVMMTNWLGEGEDRLPANASHQVGVGCVVAHEGKVLLVQEKSGPLRGSGVWKIPTGLVDSSEELAEAAVREVKEETGIDTEFVKVLCFRHAHQMMFGKSDLFFLCLLTPKTFDITHQEAEIVACEWKELDAFTEQAFFKRSPVHELLNGLVRQELATASDEALRTGLKVHKLPIGWRSGEQTVYYPANYNK